MITYSNRAVFPAGTGAPSLEDIAVGLGRIPRFAGQTRDWYPVLGHILVVSRIIDPKYALHGLLHDATEAVVSDVPTPWKTVAAKRREQMLLKRIYKSLDLEMPDAEAQEAVANADRTALAAEAHVLGHAAASHIWPVYDMDAYSQTCEQLGVCRSYINHKVAIEVFTSAYEQLREQHGFYSEESKRSGDRSAPVAG